MGYFTSVASWRTASRQRAFLPKMHGAYFRDKDMTRRSEDVKKLTQVARMYTDEPLPKLLECVADGMDDYETPRKLRTIVLRLQIQIEQFR